MAYKINITRPFRCCMNTYTPQKDLCVLLDGCLSSFVISNKYINHHGKRISSHLMADRSVYEINFLLFAFWFITFINGKMKKIICHTWYGCKDVLFSAYLRWSYEVNHCWPDMKHQWALIRAQKDHPSPDSVLKSERLEMARMICSYSTNMKKQYPCLPLLTIFNGMTALITSPTLSLLFWI